MLDKQLNRLLALDYAGQDKWEWNANEIVCRPKMERVRIYGRELTGLSSLGYHEASSICLFCSTNFDESKQGNTRESAKLLQQTTSLFYCSCLPACLEIVWDGYSLGSCQAYI